MDNILENYKICLFIESGIADALDSGAAGVLAKN